MTNDINRRKVEWDRRCPSPTRIWMPPIIVRRRRRAEALAHLLLELRCFDRPRVRCFRCRRVHVEIFSFSAERSFVWRKIVLPLLLMASRTFMHKIQNTVHELLYALQDKYQSLHVVSSANRIALGVTMWLFIVDDAEELALTILSN
ncbi:hypothetical protein EV361DRAFT_887327 [Lentinula raphanica]|nr:hypothetical protein EV361DRAFT_887327 [Lentinula raphanica]